MATSTATPRSLFRFYEAFIAVLGEPLLYIFLRPEPRCILLTPLLFGVNFRRVHVSKITDLYVGRIASTTLITLVR
ncbi:MAG: hypothetical protein DRN91_00965 [Candidatus Alkanophagales archaeon]|nr:MAG: hypothetical protein DRN91_00965 [Candidatus Alkanophagales archaeon]